MKLEYRSKIVDADGIASEEKEKSIAIGLRAMSEDSKETRIRLRQRDLERTVSTVNQAIILAQEKGVDPSFVFEDDDLHAELIRKSISPDEYAADYLAFANANSYEDLVDLRITAGLESSGQSSIDYNLRRSVRSQFDTPAFREMFERRIRAMKQMAVERLTYYWGDDVLASLPQDLQEGLSFTHRGR